MSAISQRSLIFHSASGGSDELSVCYRNQIQRQSGNSTPAIVSCGADVTSRASFVGKSIRIKESHDGEAKLIDTGNSDSSDSTLKECETAQVSPQSRNLRGEAGCLVDEPGRP